MPPPRNRPARRGAPGEPSRGRPALPASQYRWPCPHCACQRNLQVLGREVCSNCLHIHTNPDPARKGDGPC
jgi:hypothetical protein